MEYRTGLFKIKTDKINIWRKWVLRLENNNEASQSLDEEEMEYESYSIFKIKNEYYCLASGYGKFLKAKEDSEINKLHNKKKVECLEKKIDIENFTIYRDSKI